MTVRVSWAKCSTCGQWVPVTDLRFDAHATSSGRGGRCDGTNADARSALGDAIKRDVEQFQWAINNERERIVESERVIKKREEWIASARAQLAELEVST